MATSSWIEDYLTYTQNQQSPTVYHFWVGISIIASVLGRNVWLDRGDDGISYYKDYPGQLFTMLIGKSASTKKTTAMDIGSKLMVDSGVTIVRGSGSPEGLLKSINEKCNSKKPKLVGTRLTMGGNDAVITILAPEASVFLGKESYNQGMIGILTDLYDAKDIPFERSLSGKSYRLENYCITTILCATPENIGDSMPANMHTFGFLGRLHAIYSDTPRSINPLTNIGKSQANLLKIIEAKKKYQSLLVRLENYANLRGAFDFTDEGRRFFEQWNIHWFNKPENAHSTGWPQRRPDHMLRLAMILVVSSSSTDLLIDEKDLKNADKCLHDIEKNFVHAFAEVGQDHSAKRQQKILDILTVGGDVPVRNLYLLARKYFKSKEEIQSVVNMLQLSGEIECIFKILGDPNSQIWRIKK